MEVKRTAPVKLVIPDEYRADPHETAEQFLYHLGCRSMLSA